MTPKAAEANRVYQRLWRKNNPEEHLKRQAAWRLKNPDSKKRSALKSNSLEETKRKKKLWAENNREKVLLSSRRRKLRIRQAILDAYGNKCTFCGFDKDQRALDLDHINNNGGEERKKLGIQTMNDIVFKLGFPDSYQLLCRNCNWLKYLDSRRIGQEVE